MSPVIDFTCARGYSFPRVSGDEPASDGGEGVGIRFPRVGGDEPHGGR